MKWIMQETKREVEKDNSTRAEAGKTLSGKKYNIITGR